MQDVVLAVDEGSQLRPLTEDKSKTLVEVAGRPILGHSFDNPIELGADELLVVVGFPEDREEAERRLEEGYEPEPGGATALSERAPTSFTPPGGDVTYARTRNGRRWLH